jgi:hypothetical protein
LDFDRTLASTRSGASPVFGKDSVDVDLCSLLWQHQGTCAIVTRNSHVQEIRDFLTAHGAPEDLPIHSLKKPRSKAEYILEGIGDGEQVIFVDDTIAELMDPMVSSASGVHRVLFLRGLI